MKWLNFFNHHQANPDLHDIWTDLYFNLIFSLVPFIFLAPVPATLICAFVALASYFFHILNLRIYGPLTYIIGLILLAGLRTTFSHGAFGGELFATLFAVLALCKTFNIRNYDDGILFLILTLATNCGVLLLDTDSSILVLVWAFAAILWTLGNLLRINIKDFSSLAVIASLKSAMQATLYTLPLLLFLFYIFHRFSHSPFYFEHNEGITGISQSLEPGKISRLSASSGIAFRVKMNENDFPLSELYWRGFVLSHSRGMVWQVPKHGQREIESPPRRASSTGRCLVDQTIYLQRSGLLPSKFALDEPLMDSFTQGTPYHVTSNLCSIGHLVGNWEKADFERYLQVDIPIHYKVLKLAQSLKGETGSLDEFRRNIFHFFKKENFKYSLTPQSKHSNLTLEDFLFGAKEGFCEHYAAATATLARLVGIPSRIVTGFAGGNYNPYGNFWIISYSDAHAWVELWDSSEGWIRVDPTAIIAPHRLERQTFGQRYNFESIGMFFDAFFFWVRGLFDNRDTLVSLDDLTFNPIHLCALLFVLLCWLQVRRLNYDYTSAVRASFMKVNALLNEKTIRRERSEGFEAYRQRLLTWLEGQKELRPLSKSIDQIFRRFIRLKYSATGLTPRELKTLHSELKILRRALLLKTNFLTHLLRRY